MTVNWNTCAFADEGCTCGRPSLAMVEQTELEKLRAQVAELTAALTESRTQAATYANEIGALKAELERMREQVFAQKPVINAAQAWAEAHEDNDVVRLIRRPSAAPALVNLYDAVEQYRLMDLALTSARAEQPAGVAR
ncbi:hypothetical protein ACGF5C_31705 [Micromonospora sp. NPDC047620]